LRGSLGDNHGSEEYFQNIRGSDGPQHGDEPGSPEIKEKKEKIKKKKLN